MTSWDEIKMIEVEETITDRPKPRDNRHKKELKRKLAQAQLWMSCQEKKADDKREATGNNAN